MTETAPPLLIPAAARIQPAGHQSPLPADRIVHSGNAGFIQLRSAQLRYGLRRDGRAYLTEVARFMNRADLNSASFFYFEELFGRNDRAHFLISWKSPQDYALSVEMVDHDTEMADLLESDRVTDEAGTGDWAKTIVEASMQERVMIPQHGGPEPEDGEHPHDDTWVEPAWRQCVQPPEVQLNTATAPYVVHRAVQARHGFRNEARAFAFAWQNRVNELFAGSVTCYLYEETFGRMDQLHWLIHLRSLEDWLRIERLADHDAQYAELFTRQWIRAGRGGGIWADAFVDGTLHDTLLVPFQIPAEA
ncbi:MAG: hypothetical protein HOV87_18280 [Catenulispora sp.]|nr:hypothetical protein [Catenulispora sp.]